MDLHGSFTRIGGEVLGEQEQELMPCVWHMPDQNTYSHTGNRIVTYSAPLYCLYVLLPLFINIRCFSFVNEIYLDVF
jgi:hypothetical protein